MPKYEKFLKDLLTNNRKLEEVNMVAFNGVCSSIIDNKLPKKLRDPAIFVIPFCLVMEWKNIH